MFEVFQRAKLYTSIGQNFGKQTSRTLVAEEISLVHNGKYSTPQVIYKMLRSTIL